MDMRGLFAGSDENAWNLIWLVVTQHCEYTKCHGNGHFKMVGFMLCEFYFSEKKKVLEDGGLRYFESCSLGISKFDSPCCVPVPRHTYSSVSVGV